MSVFNVLLILAIYCIMTVTATCNPACTASGEECADDSICRIKCSNVGECATSMNLPAEVVRCTNQKCYQSCSHQGMCIFPSGQKCTNGLCTMGCQTNANCTSQQTCVTSGENSGVCGWKCSPTCTSPKSCSIDGQCRTVCVTDTNCSQGFVCRAGSCFRACTATKDCLRDGRLSCWRGVCRDKCAKVGECPDGYSCSLAGTCEKVCHFDDDCDVVGGEICIGGVCKTGCKGDMQCGEQKTCNVILANANGTCSWSCKDGCKSDTDLTCGVDGICRKQCKNCDNDKEHCLYGLCFKECKRDSDCAETPIAAGAAATTPPLYCIGGYCMARCVTDSDCSGGRKCSFRGECNFQCKDPQCPHSVLCALDGVCRFKTATCPAGYHKNDSDGFCYLEGNATDTRSDCDPLRTDNNGKPLNPSIFEHCDQYTQQQLSAQASSPLVMVSMKPMTAGLCQAGCIQDLDCNPAFTCNEETHTCVRRADSPVLKPINSCWKHGISLEANAENLSFVLVVQPRDRAECRAAFPATVMIHVNLSDYADTLVQSLSDFNIRKTERIYLTCNPSTIQNCKTAMVTSMSGSVSVSSSTHIMKSVISDIVVNKYNYNICFNSRGSSIHIREKLDSYDFDLCAWIAWSQNCPYLKMNQMLSFNLGINYDADNTTKKDIFDMPIQVMTPATNSYCVKLSKRNQTLAKAMDIYLNNIWLTGTASAKFNIDGVVTDINIDLYTLTTSYLKDCIQTFRAIISPSSIYTIVEGRANANGESCSIPSSVDTLVLSIIMKDENTDNIIILEKKLNSFSYDKTKAIASVCGTNYKRTTSHANCTAFYATAVAAQTQRLNSYTRLTFYEKGNDSGNGVIQSSYDYQSLQWSCYNNMIVILEARALTVTLVPSKTSPCSIPTVEQAAVMQGATLVNMSSTDVQRLGSLKYTLSAEIYTNISMTTLMGRFSKQDIFHRNAESVLFSCSTDWVPSEALAYAGMSCKDVIDNMWKMKSAAFVGFTAKGITNTSLHSGFIPSFAIQSKNYTVPFIITLVIAGAILIALVTMGVILIVRLRRDIKDLNLKFRAQKRQRQRQLQDQK